MKFIIFSWFSIGMAIGLIVYVLFWGFYPFKVADVVQPYEVKNANKTVTRETDLILEANYFKYMNVRTQSDRMIICDDGNLVTLSPSFSNLPMGQQTLNFKVTIPAKTSLGLCKYRQVVQYFVNPLQTQNVIFESEKFLVI